MKNTHGIAARFMAQAVKSRHSPGTQTDVHAQRIMGVLLLCASMMIVEMVAGLLFGSMALLADGLHIATHGDIMLVATAAFRIAQDETPG